MKRIRRQKKIFLRHTLISIYITFDIFNLYLVECSLNCLWKFEFCKKHSYTLFLTESNGFFLLLLFYYFLIFYFNKKNFNIST